MKIVYFENSYGKRKELGWFFTNKQANEIITKHLQEHNYKSYYRRWWFDERTKEWWCDVGSHSEFYIIIGEDEHFLD